MAKFDCTYTQKADLNSQSDSTASLKTKCQQKFIFKRQFNQDQSRNNLLYVTCCFGLPASTGFLQGGRLSPNLTTRTPKKQKALLYRVFLLRTNYTFQIRDGHRVLPLIEKQRCLNYSRGQVTHNGFCRIPPKRQVMAKSDSSQDLHHPKSRPKISK